MKSNLRNEIKSYIVRQGMTMQEVVDLLHDEHGWSDSILHQVHLQLPTVLFFLARQKIRHIGRLHQNLACILLVAQHPVDGGGAPL